MATTTRGILAELVDTIEALPVSDPASPDDRFRALVGQRTALRGSRAVVLSGTGGRRVNAGRTCADWETVITIDVYYVDPQGRALPRALDDAETIASGLYDWIATNTIGASKIETDLAIGTLIDDGDLLVSRTARVIFEYGA